MTHVEFLRLFRKEFRQAISRKTSWGRKELELVVEEVCANVLAKLIDKKTVTLKEVK